MSCADPIRAYVAIGANLGEPLLAVAAAFDELARMPLSALVARSSIYRSAPVGVADQPDYFNAVAALDTALSPDALLNALLEIERRHGRQRLSPQAARTLDLDLLLYGQVQIDRPFLQLPHPRMHERAFVLAPLAEIAPDVDIPGRDPLPLLLTRVAGQTIERLAS